MTPQFIQKTLPLGAEMLACKAHTETLDVILCKFQGEFVTWIASWDTQEVFWGHYFMDKQNAVDDYLFER